MRQIGNLSDEREAQTFQDFLLTRGVNAQLEADADSWAIWVFDEDNVETAKQELEAFRANPNDQRYADSRAEAIRIRDEMIKQAKEARKNVVDVRKRWEGPVSSRCPVTIGLIAISIAVAFSSRLGQQYEPIIKALSFASADQNGYYYLFRSEHNDIRRGEIWRLMTPVFIHSTFLHILFNMLWLRDLGMAIELRRGSLRFLAMVLIIAAISNTAQYAFDGPSFGGMSGVVFGLFGYIWMRSRYDPGSGFFLPPITIFLMMGWFVFCMTGLAGPIANLAHGAGLATGAVLGYAPIAWRNAMRD